MDRTLRRVLTRVSTAALMASLLVVAAVAPAAAQDASEADAADTDASIEAFIDALSAEIEQTDGLIGALVQARRQGPPALVVPPGRVIDLTADEANILVAYWRSRGRVFTDAPSHFRLAEMLEQARDRGPGIEPGSTDGLVTTEEATAYWEQLSGHYGELEGLARGHREALVSVVEGLASLAEEAETAASSDDHDDVAAERYPGTCVFRTGYSLDRSLFPVTEVIAWKSDDFDPEWARFEYAAATPDYDAEDPNHRIERMRRNVSALEGITVEFDGKFAGFCAWTEATCPNTSPKYAGNPVCEDGQPVME